MARTKGEKEEIEAKSHLLIRMAAEFCDLYLNDEYRELSEKLILKMKRKRQVPFMRGTADTWAAAVIFALGQINFLFDPETEPTIKPDVIADHFGISRSTVGQKAKTIRDMFDLFYWHPEFSTAQMADSDPNKDMVVIDGFIVPISMLPPKVQAELRRQQER
ncbi:MAG: hypothetical protein JXA42_14970 [Anaerolineales bacterium]|nr:hypothetical protein [Anaerolineales bacterium]